MLKFLDTMATNFTAYFTNKGVRKNINRKIANFCETVAKGIVAFLACAVMALIISPILFIIAGILYNPICIAFWLLVSPKSAIRSIQEENARRVEEFTWLLLWGKCVWTWLANKTLLAIAKYLWRIRKEYIRQTGLKNASIRDQVRYFNEGDKVSLLEEGLSPKLLDRVWCTLTKELRYVAIEAGQKLSTKQFNTLVNFREWESIRVYMNKYTLSEKMILGLFNGADFNSDGFDYLQRLIWGNGLSANLISAIFKDGDVEKVKDIKAIESALEVYAQREAVKSWYAADLKKFFKLQTKVHYMAQQLMTEPWQYELYHECGFTLDMVSIEYFLAQENCKFISAVIKNEVVGKEISAKANALILANPRLMQLMANYAITD